MAGSSGPNYTQSAEPSQQKDEILGPVFPPMGMQMPPQQPFGMDFNPMMMQGQMAPLSPQFMGGMPPSPMQAQGYGQDFTPQMMQPFVPQQQPPPMGQPPAPQQSMMPQQMAGPTPGARPGVDFSPAPPMQPNYPLGPPIPAQVDWNAIAAAQTHPSPLQRFFDYWRSMDPDEAQARLSIATAYMANPAHPEIPRQMEMKFMEGQLQREQNRYLAGERMEQRRETEMDRKIQRAQGLLSTFDEETIAEYRGEHGAPVTEKAIAALPDYAAKSQRRKKYATERSQYLQQAAKGLITESDAKVRKVAETNQDPDLLENIKRLRESREEMLQSKKDIQDKLQKQRDALLELARARLARSAPKLHVLETMIAEKYRDMLRRADIPARKAFDDLTYAFNAYGTRDQLAMDYDRLSGEADEFYSSIAMGQLGQMLGMGEEGGGGQGGPTGHRDLSRGTPSGGGGGSASSPEVDALIKKILGSM